MYGEGEGLVVEQKSFAKGVGKTGGFWGRPAMGKAKKSSSRRGGGRFENLVRGIRKGRTPLILEVEALVEENNPGKRGDHSEWVGTSFFYDWWGNSREVGKRIFAVQKRKR